MVNTTLAVLMTAWGYSTNFHGFSSTVSGIVSSYATAKADVLIKNDSRCPAEKPGAVEIRKNFRAVADALHAF